VKSAVLGETADSPEHPSEWFRVILLGMKSTGLAPYFGVEMERFVRTRLAWQKQTKEK
jgi:hypothetical protein